MNYKICNIHKIKNKIDSINATIASLFLAQAFQCRGEAKSWCSPSHCWLFQMVDLTAASEVLVPSKSSSLPLCPAHLFHWGDPNVGLQGQTHMWLFFLGRSFMPPRQNQSSFPCALTALCKQPPYQLSGCHLLRSQSSLVDSDGFHGEGVVFTFLSSVPVTEQIFSEGHCASLLLSVSPDFSPSHRRTSVLHCPSLEAIPRVKTTFSRF